MVYGQRRMRMKPLNIIAEKTTRPGGMFSTSAAFDRNNAEIGLPIFFAMRSSCDLGVPTDCSRDSFYRRAQSTCKPSERVLGLKVHCSSKIQSSEPEEIRGYHGPWGQQRYWCNFFLKETSFPVDGPKSNQKL